MNLLYAGRRENSILNGLGGRHVGLERLLGEADFVSLHVPLTAETTHLINARTLSLMKPTAYLINTSRGPVVDEVALVEALKSHRIAGAGLDVYEREPCMAHGLAECENAVLLPHLGSATFQTRSRMSRIAAENVIAVLEGRRPPNLVNPDAWHDLPDPSTLP
jgi:glyoxylate reductase